MSLVSQNFGDLLNMRNSKIIYWITTTIFSVSMLVSGYRYLADARMVDSFNHLGFPGYFRVELGIAKVLGAIVLLIPLRNLRIKEFAYAGFTVASVSAIIAHTAVSDPVVVILKSIIMLVLLMISWIFFDRLQFNRTT
jgi:hypothetical protein